MRRAKALGVLADPQYALTLTDLDADSPRGGENGGDSPARPRRGQGRSAPALHVHLHLDAVTGTHRESSAQRKALVARVTGGPNPGARPVEAVERWIAGLRPGAAVTVTPVVDLTEHLPVDAYEVPRRLRNQLEHRDLTCRFHHRLKTHGGWTCQLTHDTVLTWTSPLGSHYTVDENGTLPRD